MKIQILSDIHLEFRDYKYQDAGADVIVFAGDIGAGHRGREWIENELSDIDKPKIYVLGNHEYYNETLGELAQNLKEWNGTDDLFILDNDSFVYDDVRFLGMTLWTDFNLYPARMAEAVLKVPRYMSDFRAIYKNKKMSRTVSPADIIEEHNNSVEWLKARLKEKGDWRTTVIVGHHMPSLKSVSKKYDDSIINAAFASNLDNLMMPKYNISAWIHGHTHDVFDYKIRKTRVVCNPRGYPGEKSGFRDDFVIEV